MLCTDRDFENAWRLFILFLGLFSLRSYYLIADSLGPRPLPSLHMRRRYSALSIAHSRPQSPSFHWSVTN